MQNPIKKPLPKLIHADDLKHISEEELLAEEGKPKRGTNSHKVKNSYRVVLEALEDFGHGREAHMVSYVTGFTLHNTIKFLNKLVKQGLVTVMDRRYYVLTADGAEKLKAND